MCKNKPRYFYVNLGKIVEPNIKKKKKEKIKSSSRRMSRWTKKEVIA